MNLYCNRSGIERSRFLADVDVQADFVPVGPDKTKYLYIRTNVIIKTISIKKLLYFLSRTIL